LGSGSVNLRQASFGGKGLLAIAGNGEFVRRELLNP
jgi:hypothetical protein